MAVFETKAALKLMGLSGGTCLRLFALTTSITSSLMLFLTGSTAHGHALITASPTKELRLVQLDLLVRTSYQLPSMRITVNTFDFFD